MGFEAVSMYRFLHTLSAGFHRRSEGSVAVTFALTLLPLVVAVDYSRANGVKAALQATIDSAVVAGAKDGTSN